VFSARFVVDGPVTTNPVRPGQGPAGYRAGAQQGAAGPADAGVPAPRTPGNPGAFDVTLRGYDRTQVDERVADLLRQLSAATEQNRTLSSRLADEQRRADTAERLVRELRTATPAPRNEEAESGQGFGYRAERILRMAEAEAHETRSVAVKEATELLERARAEAEIHRHEIEQNLIMRATALDQKANEVSAALRDREQALAAELTSARSEAESVRLAARHEMEQARKNVEIIARDVRAQAERWAEEHRAGASREVARLVSLRDNLHGNLAQLSQSLLAGLDAEDKRTAKERAEAERDTADEPGKPTRKPNDPKPPTA
jgi:cell division septum initiation protein DivIVA